MKRPLVFFISMVLLVFSPNMVNGCCVQCGYCCRKDDGTFEKRNYCCDEEADHWLRPPEGVCTKLDAGQKCEDLCCNCNMHELMDPADVFPGEGCSGWPLFQSCRECTCCIGNTWFTHWCLSEPINPQCDDNIHNQADCEARPPSPSPETDRGFSFNMSSVRFDFDLAATPSTQCSLSGVDHQGMGFNYPRQRLDQYPPGVFVNTGNSFTCQIGCMPTGPSISFPPHGVIQNVQLDCDRDVHLESVYQTSCCSDEPGVFAYCKDRVLLFSRDPEEAEDGGYQPDCTKCVCGDPPEVLPCTCGQNCQRRGEIAACYAGRFMCLNEDYMVDTMRPRCPDDPDVCECPYK